MTFALSSELRKRFWRDQSALVWLGPPARDKELYRLIDQLATAKATELGQDLDFDANRRRVAILTDARGTVLACVVTFGDMLEWAMQTPDVGDGRNHLLDAIDLVQQEQPRLLPFGLDPETDAALLHILREHPERRPEREAAE